MDRVIATLLAPGGIIPVQTGRGRTRRLRPTVSEENSAPDGRCHVGRPAFRATPRLSPPHPLCQLATAVADCPLSASARPSPREEGTVRVPASPAARRLARERGIDIAALKGTGPRGRIVAADIEAALAARSAAEGSTDIPAIRRGVLHRNRACGGDGARHWIRGRIWEGARRQNGVSDQSGYTVRRTAALDPGQDHGAADGGVKGDHSAFSLQHRRQHR